ncbi:MAG: DUF502 domain-containing protein [Verrucomicrobiia bacterium]
MTELPESPKPKPNTESPSSSSEEKNVLLKPIAILGERWQDLVNRTPWLKQALGFLSGLPWGGFLSTLRNRLLAGVIVAIPIIVTIWVLQIAFKFIKGVSEPYLKLALKGEEPPEYFSFAITLLVLLGLGFMATNVMGRQIIEMAERLMLRIPGVASIFSATKQVMESFRGMGSTSNFQRVVFVEYPSKGCRLIGFVTGQFFDPVSQRDVTSVFLPTSPNPITGFVMVVDNEFVIESFITIEEALKMLFSAGLVTPKKRVSTGFPYPEARVSGEQIAKLETLRQMGEPARIASDPSSTEGVANQPPAPSAVSDQSPSR